MSQPTIGTLQSDLQSIEGMYAELVNLQKVRKEKRNLNEFKDIVDADKASFEFSHGLNAELEKFFGTLFNEINLDAERMLAASKNDPRKLEEAAAGLDELHKLFAAAHRVYRQLLRNAHYFYQFTAKLDRLVKKRIKGVKSLEAKHIAKVKEENAKKKKAEREIMRKWVAEKVRAVREKVKRKKGDR